MSAAGTQMVTERSGQMSLRLNVQTLGFILAVLLQILAGVYAYGRLTASVEAIGGRVDGLHSDVQEIRSIILQRGIR